MKAIIRLDLKLIGSSKTVIAVLFLSFFFFFLMASGLVRGAEQRSSLPVGITDLDNSEESVRLTEELKKLPSFYVYEGDEAEMERLLRNEKILASLRIKKGYGDMVGRGDIRNAISVSYLKNNYGAPLIADIAAGEMMYEVCLGRSGEVYGRLEQAAASVEDYRNGVDRMKESSSQEGFLIRFVSPDGTLQDKQGLKNSLLYQQLIMGMYGVVSGFLILFLTGCVWTEKSSPAARRIRAGGIGTIRMCTAHGIVILAAASVMSLISMCFLILPGQMGAAGYGRLFFTELLAGFAYLILFIIIREKVKGIAAYQSAAGLAVVLTGMCGMVGLFDAGILNISKIMPNYWCIEAFTAIIVGK